MILNMRNALAKQLFNNNNNHNVAKNNRKIIHKKKNENGHLKISVTKLKKSCNGEKESKLNHECDFIGY